MPRSLGSFHVAACVGDSFTTPDFQIINLKTNASRRPRAAAFNANGDSPRAPSPADKLKPSGSPRAPSSADKLVPPESGRQQLRQATKNADEVLRGKIETIKQRMIQQFKAGEEAPPDNPDTVSETANQLMAAGDYNDGPPYPLKHMPKKKWRRRGAESCGADGEGCAQVDPTILARANTSVEMSRCFIGRTEHPCGDLPLCTQEDLRNAEIEKEIEQERNASDEDDPDGNIIDDRVKQGEIGPVGFALLTGSKFPPKKAKRRISLRLVWQTQVSAFL